MDSYHGHKTLFRGPQTLFMAGQRLLGFDSSESSSTSSVRWTCFIDLSVEGQAHSWTFFIGITVDGQRPLDLISSTCRRWPACCWTYPHRLPSRRPRRLSRRRPRRLPACHWTYRRRLPRQRAAGLTHVESSMASMPLDFLASTPRQRPACRWTFSSRIPNSHGTPSLCQPTPSLRQIFKNNVGRSGRPCHSPF